MARESQDDLAGFETDIEPSTDRLETDVANYL